MKTVVKFLINAARSCANVLFFTYKLWSSLQVLPYAR